MSEKTKCLQRFLIFKKFCSKCLTFVQNKYKILVMEIEYLANKMAALNNEIKLNKACSFLRMDMPIFFSSTIEGKIKELCVCKVCASIGIKCPCNRSTGFLSFFSSVMGEAVSNKLNLEVAIACPELKFVKYDHFNLINEVEMFLENDDINEAFLDAFNFLERFKFLANRLQLI